MLHFAPDNASLIVRLALEEIGAPYRAALVDRSRREQDGAAYRALSPTGLIPALETPRGTLFETGAILLWLADTHGGLLPGPADPERGDALKWLFFLSNTLHADMRMLFYPAAYSGADPTGVRALTEARILGHLSLIDHALARRPGWCGPEAPGALGCYLGPLVRWLALYPSAGPMRPDMAAYPALAAVVSAMEQRPSVRRAALAEGLGEAPFTRPGYARPPVGSAT